MTSEFSQVRQTVARLITETLALAGRQPVHIDDGQSLFAGGIGLDSLDFATLVVRLERETGYDPFRAGHAQLPRTVGELVRLYTRS